MFVGYMIAGKQIPSFDQIFNNQEATITTSKGKEMSRNDILITERFYDFMRGHNAQRKKEAK